MKVELHCSHVIRRIFPHGKESSLDYSSSLWIIYVACSSQRDRRRRTQLGAGEHLYIAITDSAPGAATRRLKKTQHVLFKAVPWLWDRLRETKAEQDSQRKNFNDKHCAILHLVLSNKLSRNKLKNKHQVTELNSFQFIYNLLLDTNW